jgi:hypothetical protein
MIVRTTNAKTSPHDQQATHLQDAQDLTKLVEMKTPAEARRALKRRLSDAVYRRITKDQQDSPTGT